MHKKTVIDFKELGQRYIFTDPLKELIADSLDQVKPLLEQVENYQKLGYYVVGYLSYEASPAFEEKFAVADKSLMDEHLAYFTVHEEAEEVPFPSSYEPVDMPQNWQELSSKEEYETAIARIRHEIRQGNTYQVNHTMRLKAQVSNSSFAIYNRLMVEQGAGYNAYIEHDDFAVVSASPELFFQKNGQRLITRPMKGTIERGLTAETDLANRDWLSQDPKNRAENMMIVDLLRNDMGRICQIGSVQVTKLCVLEKYSTVWQMTSTIEGDLSDDSLTSIFKALFPCGSITGAPKISTMKVINELEDQPRGVYCGTMGICLPDGRAIFNVPIRTLQIRDKDAFYGVGGGITWDSQWESEYEETRQKSAVLYRQNPEFSLISTGRFRDGQLELKEAHLKRLEEAAQYFSYPFSLEKWQSCLKDIAAAYPKGNYRLRLSLNKYGQISCDCQPLQDLSQTFCQARLIQRDLKMTPFVTFKTSHRPHIEMKEYEQIFVSSQGTLQETSIGNLILEIEGKWYTPRLEDGCLPGIYRQKLLDEKKVVEAQLSIDDLIRAEVINACNAVRGLFKLTLSR